MKRRGNFDIFSKYTWYVPGWADIVILLVWLLIGALLGNLLTAGLQSIVGTTLAVEYSSIISYPVMFVPAMIYAASKSRRNSLLKGGIKLVSAHFKPVGGAVCAILVAVATFCLGLATDALNSLLPAMPDFLKKLLESMTSGNFFINFLCVSVMAPFFEEWLCRGMVLRGLLGHDVKPVWAIAASALFFAIIHFNPWQAVPAFVLGCLFGYVYFKTGSLALTMLMHCVNNTISLVVSRIDSLQNCESWVDLLGGAYWAAFAASIALVAVIIFILNRIPLASGRGNCDEVGSVFENREQC